MPVLTGDNETFKPSMINLRTITIDTGANLSAITPTTGKVVFCTSTGSGFTVNHLYVYNGSAWVDIPLLTIGLTLTNFTLDANLNTFTNISGASFANAVITAAQLGILSTVAYTTGQSGQTTTSTTYVDLYSVTITALGGRAGLLTRYTGAYGCLAATTQGTFAITDGSNTVIKEVSTVGPIVGTSPGQQPFCCGVMEAAPSAGSLTRKLRWKTNSGTSEVDQYNSSHQMVTMEIP
jgi:hypothetical protein